MENNKINTDQLWDYADGFLESEEKRLVEAYLRQNPEAQAQLNAILAEKRNFSKLDLEKPKSDFAQQVMAAWTAEQATAKKTIAAPEKGRDWVLWGIYIVFGAMVAALFAVSIHAAPGTGGFQLPEEYLPQVQMPSFDWAGLFGSAMMRNTLLITIAFMGLKLLDKYLQVRKLHLPEHS